MKLSKEVVFKQYLYQTEANLVFYFFFSYFGNPCAYYTNSGHQEIDEV